MTFPLYITLYRIVPESPGEEDFLSNLGKCLQPRGTERLDPTIWTGTSTYETRELAQATARHYRRIGTHLAQLQIPNDDPRILVRPTLSPGHYTLLGCARLIRAYMAAISAVED